MSYGFFHIYYFHNNNLLKNRPNGVAMPSGIAVYEVLKIIAGTPLFTEDHIERLHNSMKIAGIKDFTISRQDFSDKVTTLCKENEVYYGNIEICVSESENKTVDCYIGFIPHKYPKPLDYIEGVSVLLMQAERKNPNTKVKYTKTRLKANEFLKKNTVFEVIFENQNGYITEGSRSNVFFIRDKVAYTSPHEFVLSGITRKYVIESLKSQNIEVIEKLVQKTDLPYMDAAFLCGTSPGIIPIKQIDDYRFNVNNTVLRNAIVEYNSYVQQYMALNS